MARHRRLRMRLEEAGSLTRNTGNTGSEKSRLQFPDAALPVRNSFLLLSYAFGAGVLIRLLPGAAIADSWPFGTGRLK
jgi:hypothetical protein